MTGESAEAPRGSRFDSWFEPPWHTLLLWVALAAITGALLDAGLADRMENVVDTVMERAAVVAPGWMVVTAPTLAGVANFVFLVVWYQPLLLRLGVSRWLIWVVGAALTGIVFAVLGMPTGRWEVSLFFWAWPSLAGLLLFGSRTRPWMSLPAGLLAFTLGGLIFYPQFDIPWWWLPATSLPYATVMLYGTRRLPRVAMDRSGALGED